MTMSTDCDSGKVSAICSHTVTTTMGDQQDLVKLSLDNLTLSGPLPNFALGKQATGLTMNNPPESYVFVSNNQSLDSGSIVVLDRSSLDSIQMQSMVCYEQIKQKSLALDCSSIISSLTPPEIEQKLTQVLQENLKLKDTLELNNQSMKHHLVVLSKRQQELTQVHETHRQKFSEMKKLVASLRIENRELKEKLERVKITEGTSQGTQTEKEVEKEVTQETVATSTISEESERATEMMMLADKCEEQGHAIANMQRTIVSLKQELETLYQNSFSSLKLEDVKSPSQHPKDSFRQNFLQSFAHYSEKLQSLGNCYAAQSNRYTNIQQSLQRCNEILAENSPVPSEESQKRKELQNHRNRLMDEELQSILDRQEMIKAQNDFQKIFTDYNATLLELESLRKEKQALTTLQRGASLHDERFDEARANLKENERLLEDQKRNLERERLELSEQKDAMKRERLRLQDNERKVVEQNVNLLEEAMALRESNNVLCEQLKVYEADYAEERKLQRLMADEKTDLLSKLRNLETERLNHIKIIRTLSEQPDGPSFLD